MAKKVSKTTTTTKVKTETKSSNKKISPIDVVMAHKNAKLNSDFLKKIGLDPSIKKIEISKNLTLVNGLLGYALEVKDKALDLDGNPIEENEKLINRIVKLWKAGKDTISFDEMIELNVFTPKSSFKLGKNISLNSSFSLTKYNISLIDDEKDIDGKWHDKAVSVDKVVKTLLKFDYDAKMRKLNEVALNLEIEQYLKEHFATVKKSASSDKGDIDVLIGSDKNVVAIELKLARSLNNAGESERAVGQIRKYSKKFGSNLLVVIAGTKAEQQHVYVKEVIDEAKDVRVKHIFIEPD